MKQLPTMSTRGWAKTPETIIDNIFTYYQASNPSQSFTYLNAVHSIQYAIKEAAGRPDTLARLIQEDLTEVLSRYFPEGAFVDTGYNYIDDNDSQINIDISGHVMYNGEKYNLVKSIGTINSHFRDVSSAIVIG